MSEAHATATATDWMARAQALEETTSEFWKPEIVGDALAGKVLTVDGTAGKTGDSVLVEVSTEDGKVVGLWLSTVLEREWSRQHVKIGDIIGVKYFGRKTSKSGREYKSFALKVLERAPTKEFTDDIPF